MKRVTIIVLLVFTASPVAFGLSAENRKIIDSGARMVENNDNQGGRNFTTRADNCDPSVNSSSSFEERGRVIWDYLISTDGLTPEQVAGIMGNLRGESNFDPGINERNPLVAGSRGGFGLAQWTAGRRLALEAEAEKQNVDVANICFQLDYLVNELRGPYSAGYSLIKRASGADAVRESAWLFLSYFEIPLPIVQERTARTPYDLYLQGVRSGRFPRSDRVLDVRERYANEALDAYGHRGPSARPSSNQPAQVNPPSDTTNQPTSQSSGGSFDL